MKTEWVHKKLIDLANYYNGMAFKPSDWVESGIKIIRIEQLNNPLGKYDYFQGSYPEINAIHNEDLIFSWSATLKVAIWKWGEGVLNQHLFKVVPFESVDKYFLYYLLDYNMPKLGESSHGSTMKHIKRKELETYSVSIPSSLSAQRRIAAILSSADKVIDSTRQLIEKYKKMKQGMMEDLLKPKEGWKMVKLGECCEINPKSDMTIVQDSDVVAFIRMEDVSNDGFITSFSERTYKTMQKKGFTIFQNDDVIFAKITPCMENGKGALVRNMKSKICMGSTEFHVLRACDNVSIDFIYQLTISKRFRQKAEMQMTGSAGQQRVPSAFLENYLISIPFKNDKPNLAEQHRIAAILSGIDAKIAAEEKVLEKYEKVKKGMMERILEEKGGV